MADEIDQAEGLPPEWLSDTPAGDPDERSLLRRLADDPDSGLVELADGVWWLPKRRPDRDKLS
jgi:hypothetical protein